MKLSHPSAAPTGPARLVRGLSLGAAVLALTAAAGLTSLPRAEAQTEDKQAQKFGETIVTADNLDYDLGKKQVVATGHVDMVSGYSHMTSDHMTVQMTQTRELDWAHCEGNVWVQKKNPEEGTSMEATGKTLDYSETNQNSVLDGGVIAHMSSPRLSKPALVTGSRINMDMKTNINIVHRSPEAQAKVHVEPKGDDKNTMPEPLDLIGDQIQMNSDTQEYVATGKPVMQKPTSKLQAKVIRFTVEKATNDVKQAFAENDVIYDGQAENGDVVHATGDHGVFDRDPHEITLTGLVNAAQKGPMDDEPTIYQGGKWVHNTLSRKSVLTGTKEHPARVILPQSKTQKKPDADATKTDGDKKPDDKKGTEKKPDDKKATDKKTDGEKKTDGKDK